ncbi:SpoIIE family protein phosphatase [Actinomadura sp. ATCC 31491]|uniref:SpoIIE family protein phosphatase n=1 Tax=Actinomadura luzonensis TaxID=2805427 RepID=A0ABT0FX56_9ACTN|nr:SpoIIE family protein phosphatase [Actinomadura luzonensis]MCK2216924.1 SpoIIE family protein phosphatase [Actinomadura luzonensis]
MREDTAPPPGPQRLDNLLVQAITRTGAHIGAVYLLADDGRMLLMDVQLGMPAPVAMAWARLRLNDPVPIAAAVRDDCLVWISGREDLARQFPASALSLPYHFAAAVCPIRGGGRTWGALLLLWPAGRARTLSRAQLDAVEASSSALGDVLREGDARGTPITPGPRPRILNPRPARSTDPDAHLVALGCLNRLPEGYCALDVEGRVVLVTEPAAHLLSVHAADLRGRRLDEALPWLDDPVYEDRYRAAVVSRRATTFTGRSPAGRLLTFRLFPGLTGITVRVTDTGTGGDPAGGGTGDRVPQTPGDRPGRVIALHEMLHLATTLARAVTAQEVIDLVADHVMPVYDVQALAILTTKGGRMRVAASRGYSRQAVDDFDGRPVIPPLPERQAHDAAKPAFFATPEELRETYPDAITSDDMKAWAFLPLITSGRPFATCILAYDRPHRFSVDERATLTALAGLIAQAFERARLYDVKHQLAQCLQSSLLPRTLPEIPGLDLAARYVPATPGMDIGGDFFDLIRLSDTQAAAVIGDVQGHDVTAAALMGQVRTAIHAHATAGASPGEVLAHTNRLLVELAPDRFTSCLYASLDLERHTACLASAGHLPPLLGRPGEPTRVVETTAGLLLGIDPEAEYATLDLDLPAGAVLTLYTDGLIEQPGLDLGDAIADLAERFNPTRGGALRDLAESLIEPAALEQRTDDIAVLLLRCSGR